LITKKHYNNLLEVPAHVAAHIGSILPRLSNAIINAVQVKDFNILQNNGKFAGQVCSKSFFSFTSTPY